MPAGNMSKNILSTLFCQVSSVATTSLHAIMANVSKRTCYVMAILRVKMVQMKTTVNALPACLTVSREDAFRQHPCAMKKMTVLMGTTKKIAVS